MKKPLWRFFAIKGALFDVAIKANHLSPTTPGKRSKALLDRDARAFLEQAGVTP